jgi:dTDP-4-amino-4,6-dideoxygalactose transaminase
MSGIQADYPKERIPKTAVLTTATFRGKHDAAPACFLDVGRSKFVGSGSTAIGLALAHAGIGSKHTVLLPAYHCISMVEPVVRCAATPVFYRVHRDTSIDLSDVESKLSESTRMLVVPHYFGFPQDALRIREFCDLHGLIYLEDCAHAFFGSHTGRPLGWFGDYAIASSWKFLPTFDGGILASSRVDIDDVRPVGPGAYFHCKAALNTLEYAFAYGRLSMLKTVLSVPLKAKAYVWRNARKSPAGDRSNAKVPNTEDVAQFDTQIDSDWVASAMSWPSRITIALAAMSQIAATRRHNYRRLDESLRGVPGCRALFPALPENVVPQVFPVLFDQPARDFPRLKHAGVPIIRFGEYLWPGVDEQLCSQSIELSRRVFQFPCHQDLRAEELNWMIDVIRNVMEQG